MAKKKVVDINQEMKNLQREYELLQAISEALFNYTLEGNVDGEVWDRLSDTEDDIDELIRKVQCEARELIKKSKEQI